MVDCDPNAEIDRRFMEDVKVILGEAWPVLDGLMELEPDLMIEKVLNHHNWDGFPATVRIVTLTDCKSRHRTQVQIIEQNNKFRFHLSTDFGTLDEQQVAEILAILKRSKR